MAEIQEAANQQVWALTGKGTKFTTDMLEKLIKAFLNHNQQQQSRRAREQGKEDGLINKLDEKLTEAITGQGTNKMEFKDFMEKMDSDRGTVTSFDISEHDEIFDKVMTQYGIPYTTKEEPLLDDNGNKLYDYSKCKFEMDANNMPVMDYTGCKFEEDEFGQPIMDTRTITPNDKGGNPDSSKAFEVSEPRLAKGSPEPKPKLDKSSKKPEPIKQYTIYFDQRYTEPMTKAFKEYTRRNDLKKAHDKEKIERPKKNIKDTIKKMKEKMKLVNKESPEKHHNRGAQSL